MNAEQALRIDEPQRVAVVEHVGGMQVAMHEPPWRFERELLDDLARSCDMGRGDAHGIDGDQPSFVHVEALVREGLDRAERGTIVDVDRHVQLA